MVEDDATVPNHFRDELERSIVRSLRDAACFTGARHHSPEDQQGSGDEQLGLSVHLQAFEEQSTYDIPISALDAPDQPPDAKNNVVVQMRMDMVVELRTTAPSAAIRQKRFALSVAYRPLRREDPRFAARDDLLADAASNVIRFACKGSTKKLSREIERARASNGGGR